MSRTTQKYKRSFTGSVGAGVGALFNASGKTYYILEHKVSSRYHKAGESQKIIVDQIELGRDPSCQVRFDEAFGTVSRKHAAIIKDNDNYKLVQLSTTNSTFLNGRPIQKEWYLQSGDEIQLSVNGPKMGFIVPQGKQKLTSSINFTERFTLFRKQALKPYKAAITTLCVLLVLVAGGLTAWNVYEHDQRVKEADFAKKERGRIEKEYQERMAQMANDHAKTESMLVAEQQNNKKLKNEMIKVRQDMKKLVNIANSSENSDLESYLKHVYYIRVEKIVLKSNNGETKEISDRGWTGTGFMLKDGRFVTARHVSEGWQYMGHLDWDTQKGKYISNDELEFDLNKFANNNGKLIVHFAAYSSSGKSLKFTNESFICDRSNDKIVILEKTGERIHLSPLDYTDWAYIKTNETDGLDFDVQLASSLKASTKLIVLGYPRGYLTEKIKPLRGSGVVAHTGLDKGRILTTETNYEEGNSGGPALCLDNSGKLKVVGLISAGRGKTIGFIVPVSALK